MMTPVPPAPSTPRGCASIKYWRANSSRKSMVESRRLRNIVPTRDTGNGLAVHTDLTQNRKLFLVRPTPPALHPRHHLIAHEIPAARVADVNNDANNDGHYTSARAKRKAV